MQSDDADMLHADSQTAPAIARNCAKNTRVSGQVGTLATQAWSGFPRISLVQETCFLPKNGKGERVE